MDAVFSSQERPRRAGNWPRPARPSAPLNALFLHTAIAHSLIVLIMVVRARQRPKLPAEPNEGYVVVPRTTPAVFALDPRTELAPKPAPAGEVKVPASG